MTRVALYARYSSEGQRESSIEDQYRNCERKAKEEGWTVTHRYEDRAISGATDDRPDYQRMLKDAEGRAFDVLLIDDFSRLSRNQVETEKARRRFVYWGVRLIGVSDGIDTAAKGHKMLSNFKGIMNEHYLDDLRDKTRRGLEGQARKGNNCGGRAFGYRHVPIYHPTDKDQYGQPKIVGARREIHEEQAKPSNGMRTATHPGGSPPNSTASASRLPAPPYKRTKRLSCRYGTWSASVLHGDVRHATGLLNNPLYIGQLIWNRREWTKDPDTKQARPKLRPESEWVITPVPHLRIIPQALWEKVQAQHQARGDEQLRDGKQRTGRGPKYLLSGLLKCGDCGANFVVSSSYQYGCAGHLNRGASVCKNTLRVS